MNQESYASKGEKEAESFYDGEVACVNEAAGIAISLGATSEEPFILSVGSTPTAHAAKPSTPLQLHGTLELYVAPFLWTHLLLMTVSLFNSQARWMLLL